MNLNASIKNARRAKGWSQALLSKRLGIPQGHLSNIENGKTDLRVSSLIEIARMLDLEPMLIPKSFQPAIAAILKGESTQQARFQPDEPL